MGLFIAMPSHVNGKRMESFGVSVIDTRDGQIYGEHDYFDTGTIRQQPSIS